MDLELRFDRKDLLAVFPSGKVIACVLVKITGKLKSEFGGAAFSGEDIVSIK